MATNKYKFFILTGEPGVGKTTLTKKLCAEIADKGIMMKGFYTEEVRKNGIREGFDVVSLDGTRGRLARDQSSLNAPVKYKVGKYGVLIQEFEKVALPSMKEPDTKQTYLLVIDEVGKMELFSESFKAMIKNMLRTASNCTVLATLPLMSNNVIEAMRNHSQAKIWMVTRENRNNIHEEILKEMNTLLKFM